MLSLLLGISWLTPPTAVTAQSLITDAYPPSLKVRMPKHLAKTWVVATGKPPKQLLLDSFGLVERKAGENAIDLVLEKPDPEPEMIRKAVLATIERERTGVRLGSVASIILESKQLPIPTGFDRRAYMALRPAKTPAWEALAQRLQKSASENADAPAWNGLRNVAFSFEVSYNNLKMDAVASNKDGQAVATTLLEWPLPTEANGVSLEFTSTDPSPWQIWQRIEMAGWSMVLEGFADAFRKRLGTENVARGGGGPPTDLVLSRAVIPDRHLVILSDDWWHNYNALPATLRSFPGANAPNNLRIVPKQVGEWTVLRPVWPSMERSLWPLRPIKSDQKKLDLADGCRWLAANGPIAGSTYPEYSALTRYCLVTDSAWEMPLGPFPVLRFLGTFDQPLAERDWTPIGSLPPEVQASLRHAMMFGEVEGDPKKYALTFVAESDFVRGRYRVIRGKSEQLLHHDGLSGFGFRGSPGDHFSLDAVASYAGQWMAEQTGMPSRETVEGMIRVSIHEVDVVKVQVVVPSGERISAKTNVSPIRPPEPNYQPFSVISQERRDAFWKQALRVMRAEIRKRPPP